MAGTEGGAVKGVFDLNQELGSFRSYEIDKAPLIKKIVGEVPFFTLLMMQQKKQFVSTYKFVSAEFGEETNYLTLQGAGANVGGTHATLDVTNAQGKLLQPGQILTNHSIQWSSSSGYSNPTDTKANTLPEMGEIISVGGDDSGVAGAGFALITIKRNHTLLGSGSGTNAATVLWKGGDIVSRGNFAAYDSEGVKSPILMNPSLIYCYVQDFRKAFGVTERDMEEALFVKKNPLQYSMDNALWNFSYEIDRALLIESQGAETTGSGYNKTFTRSLNSVITTRQKIANTTIPALNNVLTTTSQIGRKTDYRAVFCSASFLTTMTNMFTPYLHEEPLNGQKDVGHTVKTYTDPLGCKYQFMYSRAVSESGYSGGAFVANMAYISLGVFKGKTRNFDLHVDMGRDGKGLQANDSKKTIGQHRFVGGLSVNYFNAHQFIYF